MTRFTRRNSLAIILGSLIVPVAGLMPAPGTGKRPSGGSPERDPQTTALLVTTTGAPVPLPASDGMDHLQYDLIVTNIFSAPVTLTEVEVLAPDGRPLLRLAGAALAGQTLPIYGAEPTDQVPAGGVVLTQTDIAVPAGQAPTRLRHRLTYDLAADARARPLITGYTIDGPELAVDPRRPIVIAPPLRGTGWFSGNPYHRAGTLAVDGARLVKPEMYAVDWIRLVDGRAFDGDGGRPEQWYGHGSDLLAVADGTVVAASDGMPDSTPGRLPTNLTRAVEYEGNYVVVQIRSDVWAVYAHVRVGSIRVRVGERVKTGQVLGTLGNSGNSTAPHLHFQLADRPPTAETGAILAANSPPFVLDRYTLVPCHASAHPRCRGAAAGETALRSTRTQRSSHTRGDTPVIDRMQTMTTSGGDTQFAPSAPMPAQGDLRFRGRMRREFGVIAVGAMLLFAILDGGLRLLPSLPVDNTVGRIIITVAMVGVALAIERLAFRRRPRAAILALGYGRPRLHAIVVALGWAR